MYKRYVLQRVNLRSSARTAFFNEIVKYEGPRITRLWEWGNTVLHEIRLSEQFLTYLLN